MSHSRASVEQGISWREAHIAWSVADQAQRLLEAAKATSPWLVEFLAQARDQVPVADTCEPFTAGPWFRLPAHVRAFYFQGGPEGVVAVKGSEVLSADVVESARRIRPMRSPLLTMSLLDHFPVNEHKVPAALLLEEAMSEAVAACEFQLEYLRRYGTLAQAPIPLLVARWPESVAESFREKMEPFLTGRGVSITNRLVKDGLGTYVYYYPGPTLRVTHLAKMLEGMVGPRHGFEARLQAMCQFTEPRKAIEGWIQLIVRALALGYFPCILTHHSVGQAIRPHNAVIDGGLVDLDSFQKMSEVKDEREFIDTFWTGILLFSETLIEFLLGNFPVKSEQWGYSSPIPAFVESALVDELRRGLKEEVKRGAKLDPRLEKVLFSEASLTERLSGAFSTMFPPLTTRHLGG